MFGNTYIRFGHAYIALDMFTLFGIWLHIWHSVMSLIAFVQSNKKVRLIVKQKRKLHMRMIRLTLKLSKVTR